MGILYLLYVVSTNNVICVLLLLLPSRFVYTIIIILRRSIIELNRNRLAVFIGNNRHYYYCDRSWRLPLFVSQHYMIILSIIYKAINIYFKTRGEQSKIHRIKYLQDACIACIFYVNITVIFFSLSKLT